MNRKQNDFGRINSRISQFGGYNRDGRDHRGNHDKFRDRLDGSRGGYRSKGNGFRDDFRGNMAGFRDDMRRSGKNVNETTRDVYVTPGKDNFSEDFHERQVDYRKNVHSEQPEKPEFPERG